MGTRPLGWVQAVCINAETQALATGWFPCVRGDAAAPRELWVRVWARTAHHHSDATAALPTSAATAPRHHQPGIFFPEAVKRSGNYTVTQTTLQKADVLPAGLQPRCLGLAAWCAQCPRPAQLLWQCPFNPVSWSPAH